MSAVVLTKVPNVLIVEDEMLLRMRAVDIVEDAGFCPIEAINADEAISILETRSDISLLFTDIQMPGSMDRLKLARVVHERWPAIKIILVSGQVVPSDDEKPLDSRFFGKPLSMQRMVTEMQSIVSSSSESQVQPPSAQEAALSAENESLRLLLEQAGIDAKALLAQAGIDAKEREAADKLQKLILGELHHRIKNTLATVSAIASQSFRAAPSVEHGQQAMEGRLAALGRAHDLLMQISWSNASLVHTLNGATEPFESQGARRFHFNGPDIRITSGSVIALAMTFNELCTNTTKFGALSVPAGQVEIACVCSVLMSVRGPLETSPPIQTMSVCSGRPEVVCRPQNDAIDPKRTWKTSESQFDFSDPVGRTRGLQRENCRLGQPLASHPPFVPWRL